jgi:hypothetical protein
LLPIRARLAPDETYLLPGCLCNVVENVGVLVVTDNNDKAARVLNEAMMFSRCFRERRGRPVGTENRIASVASICLCVSCMTGSQPLSKFIESVTQSRDVSEFDVVRLC